MKEKARFWGLDVHAETIGVAIAEPGAECAVVAPTLGRVKAGDRVKTDRRDAVKLGPAAMQEVICGASLLKLHGATGLSRPWGRGCASGRKMCRKRSRRWPGKRNCACTGAMPGWPRQLKPRCLCAFHGTAKAVPFQGRVYAASSRARRAAIAICHALLVACLATSIAVAMAQSAPPAQNLLNQQVPDFTRRDLNGHALHLNAFRGKVVLLNFWATWCAPCQVEMPAFAAWQHQYGPLGFAIIGISMDDDAATARKLVQRLKLDYPIAMGDARLGLRYGGVLGLPLSFLIDRNGVVRARFQGETDVKVMESQVRTLLAEPAQKK